MRRRHGRARSGRRVGGCARGRRASGPGTRRSGGCDAPKPRGRVHRDCRSGTSQPSGCDASPGLYEMPESADTPTRPLTDSTKYARSGHSRGALPIRHSARSGAAGPVSTGLGRQRGQVVIHLLRARPVTRADLSGRVVDLLVVRTGVAFENGPAPARPSGCNAPSGCLRAPDDRADVERPLHLGEVVTIRTRVALGGGVAWAAAAIEFSRIDVGLVGCHIG